MQRALEALTGITSGVIITYRRPAKTCKITFFIFSFPILLRADITAQEELQVTAGTDMVA